MLKKPPNQTKSTRHYGPSKQAVMRTIALFLDGMSRGLIFPFGPSLIYRLLHGGTLKLGVDCAKVAVPLAAVAAAFLLGRGSGSTISSKIHIKDETQPRIVARLSGAAISLLVFTFGAGLKSVWWLFLIRFVSGVIVGVLCKITRDSQSENVAAGQQVNTTPEEQMEEGLLAGQSLTPSANGRSEKSDFTPGTAKIYMTAVAFSILAGGLLYRHATGDATFRALTGSRQFTLSPLFLVAVSLIGESILRCFFSFFKDSIETVLEPPHRPLSLDEDSKLDLVGKSQPVKLEESDEEAPLVALRSRIDSVNSTTCLPTTRGRFDTSDSEFFDCNSVLSGMEDLDQFDNPSQDDDEVDKCRYVDRKCVDGTGAPSYVPNGDSPRIVPKNYLTLCGGRERKARAMWEETQRWRRQNDVWRIHTVPQHWFHKIKQAYPHFVHGVSKRGFPIIYEQPGKMELKQLFRDGCRVDDMLRHYMFFLEFLSNHICTRDEVRTRLGYPTPPHCSSAWGILVVMDVGGAGISHLSGDVLTYLKGAGEINNSHYPLSLKRAFLVNSPFWLAGTWRSVKGLLPDSVQVDILSKHQYLSALREYIDDDQIPREYGGSSPYKLGEHPFESLLHDLVEEAGSGEELDQHFESSASSSHKGLTVYAEDPESLNVIVPPKNEVNTTTTGLHTRRRRADHQTDIGSSMEKGVSNSPDDEGKDRYERAPYGVQEVWLIVSTIFVLWNALQGFIEIAIPLWILTPPEMGGLGYAPSRSGVAMFSSAMVLLWIFRTKVSKALSQIPCKSPMRSFRIGVGAQSVLLALLAILPRMAMPSERSDAVLVMAITIILMSGIVLSSIFGRASSAILYKTASANKMESVSSEKRRYTHFGGGHFTNGLKFAAEILGVISVAPFASWSLQQGRIPPFDGTCCLLLGSLLALVLYVGSFSLHQNFDGEKDGRSDSSARPSGSFLCEVVTVSVNDIASLFDGIHFSLNPFLRRQQTSWENYS